MLDKVKNRKYLKSLLLLNWWKFFYFVLKTNKILFFYQKNVYESSVKSLDINEIYLPKRVLKIFLNTFNIKQDIKIIFNKIFKSWVVKCFWISNTENNNLKVINFFKKNNQNKILFFNFQNKIYNYNANRFSLVVNSFILEDLKAFYKVKIKFILIFLFKNYFNNFFKYIF